MINANKKIELRELLAPVLRLENVDSRKNYAILGEKWYAKGLYIKYIKSGLEVRAKKLCIVKEGDFVYNRLFAWKGSFAIVPRELDGCYVSDEYLCFKIDEKRINPGYLMLHFSKPSIWNEANLQSSGVSSISRNRLKSDKFLSMKISVPGLDEQERTVIKIETTKVKVELAKELTKQTHEEADTLLAAALFHQFSLHQDSKIEKQAIGSVASVLRGHSPIYSLGSGKKVVNQKCVRWDGIDLSFAREANENWVNALSSRAFLQENDVVVNSTGEGTIGRACVVASNAINYPFDSHILVIRAEKTKVIPKYIAYYLRSRFGQTAIEESKGAKTTKQTELGAQKLAQIMIPAIALTEQEKIVTYLDLVRKKINGLKQAQIDAEFLTVKLLEAVLEKEF